MALYFFLLVACFLALSEISTTAALEGGSVALLDVKSVLNSLQRQEQQTEVAKSVHPQADEEEEEQHSDEILHVVHRSSLQSSFTSSKSHRELVKERLRRDAARLRSIAQRLNMALSNVKHGDLRHPVPSNTSSSSSWTHSKAGSPVGSDITSGLIYGSGEYFVRLGIGTPSKSMYLVMDTGSDVPWIQCSPCTSCYKQSDPVFDPQKSSSFHRLSCSSLQCQQLDVKSCSSGSNTCMYQVSYGDGSFTIGDLVSDSFSLRSSQSKFVFGCGHDNEGLFVGAAGLLGLGAGKLSFPSQLYGTKKFSYCLVTRDNGVRASSALLFGETSIPSSANFVYTTLLKNPRLDTFYYAPLVGISIGGNLLSIPAATFRLSSATGRGGVIVDSGTSVTRLPTAAYTAMRDAFRAGTQKLTAAPGFSLFDTCYDLSGLSSVAVPTVVFHFEGGARVQLPPGNYMVPVDSSGTFCFAFAKTGLDLSIVGNIQQQTMRVAIDLENSRIGFALKQCV